MKNQTSMAGNINPADPSVRSIGRKVWRQPQLTQLDLKSTKGGYFHVGVEDPWNFIFHS